MQIKWCKKCVLPNTRPNLFIDESGICNACKNHSSKSIINWESRQEEFSKICEYAKNNSKGYDCLIPVSGGKDSTWQTAKCVEMGLRPLALTWRPPGRTSIGQRNLDNLISLGVDHIDYTIDKRVEAKFMLKSFKKFGSTALPMHLALFNIPLSLATKFNIPLIIWGENSAFEYGNKDKDDIGFTLDSDWVKTYGVTHGTTAFDWIDHDLSEKELIPYFGPSEKEINEFKVKAIFMGSYFSWDPEMTKNLAIKNGFEVATQGARTGLYDFADIDDEFISIHHWIKWYKFGFTRLFDNLSLEIRNGRISRDDALKKIIEIGDQTPRSDIKSFCKFASISEETLYGLAEDFRNKSIWKKKKDGTWWMPQFIIDEWKWS